MSSNVYMRPYITPNPVPWRLPALVITRHRAATAYISTNSPSRISPHCANCTYSTPTQSSCTLPLHEFSLLHEWTLYRQLHRAISSTAVHLNVARSHKVQFSCTRTKTRLTFLWIPNKKEKKKKHWELSKQIREWNAFKQQDPAAPVMTGGVIN